ncbi:hypothetical protein MAPG_10656 [Magnaporthiopsis poae ATCC 64411]|uniref:Peptidase S8/S53 domain-containing protein n=1 Tax=Magnaporthiopsis poae (strain ATCC 64411 / 73-15) TaxID=644358 RepID=A0A0C4ED63_MAGP6|nr:hypothetical protein MAPG_10656 [Magnaporthiopsis poae ATCC 64411]
MCRPCISAGAQPCCSRLLQGLLYGRAFLPLYAEYGNPGSFSHAAFRPATRLRGTYAMANSQEWFEIPHRSCGATAAIYQVGQVLFDPFNLDSALFRNGSFNGKSSQEITETIRLGKALTVAYPRTPSSFEVNTGHATMIEGARIDGKGIPVLWQVLEEERIYRNDALLKAVIQEDEITRHLARPDSSKHLYLVTDVIKVQEIIPKTHEPGSLQPPPPLRLATPVPLPRFAAPSISLSEDLHLPVGFDGYKNGTPFIWKYKLERINNPEDVASVYAERYSPGRAISDRNEETWVSLILVFLFGWMWSPSLRNAIPNAGIGGSSALPARPLALEWRVEHEDLASSPSGDANGVFPRAYRNSIYPPQPPEPWESYRFPRPSLEHVNPVDEISASPDEGDDEIMRPPAGGTGVPRSPSPRRGRRKRVSSEGDLWGWRHSGKISRESTPGSPRGARAQSTGPETHTGLEAAETASLPDGLEKIEAAEKASPDIVITQDGTKQGQAAVNGVGSNETTAETKVGRIGERNHAELFAVPALSNPPAPNSPAAGTRWTEYDVFDSEPLASVPSQDEKAINAGKKWFNDAEYMKKVEKFIGRFRSGRPSERPKIAVLDTGLDFEHPLLKKFLDNKTLSRGRSLDFTLEPNPQVKGDDVGHGTHCTHLILKTCAMAEVYIAKVFNKKKADQYTASYIAKAIDHAVNNWKVDIVSMSFAFDNPHGEIEEAISKAQGAEKKVLFLAAASNYRDLDRLPVGFPANNSNVIAVFSHTLNRNRSEFSPMRSGRDNFSVLGEQLTAAVPPGTNQGDYERRDSGTSMATALMAGIAGLVIELSRLPLQEKVTAPDRLLTRAGMEAVFQLMVPKEELVNRDPNGYLCLRPWILFRDGTRHDPWLLFYEINSALRRVA